MGFPVQFWSDAATGFHISPLPIIRVPWGAGAVVVWMTSRASGPWFLHRDASRGLLPSDRQAIHSSSTLLMAHAAGYFHLHLISDATGETLITVARAAAAQYAKVMPVEHVHPLVRTQKQLDRVLA